MSRKNAIVWCVDCNERYNAMALHSMFCAREHDRISDFFMLTLKTNTYAKLYEMLTKTKVVFVDDLYERHFKHLHSAIHDTMISSFAYCRLLVLGIDMFMQYEKVLYLDCDSIVKMPIEDLFSMQLCSSSIKIMMVPEIATDGYNLKLLKHFCKRHGFMYDAAQYGNSGVALFVMQNIEAADYENALKLAKFKFPIQDQGVINYCFQGKIQFISPTYNALDETCIDKSILQHCHIRQYAGHEKDFMIADANRPNMALQNVMQKLQHRNDQSIISEK